MRPLRALLPVVLLSVFLLSPLATMAQIGQSGGGSPIGTSGGGTPIGTSGEGSSIGTSGDGTRLVNPLKAESLEELLYLLLEVAVRLGVIVLTLMLIWVGFLFVAARGNEEKLRTARTAFMWTIIGGLILLGAKGIAEVIQATATSL